MALTERWMTTGAPTQATGTAAETRGAGIINADGHTSTNPGGGQGDLTLMANIVTGNESSSPNAHSGGIDNYVRLILEPRRGRSLDTLTNTLVVGNAPTTVTSKLGPSRAARGLNHPCPGIARHAHPPNSHNTWPR